MIKTILPGLRLLASALLVTSASADVLNVRGPNADHGEIKQAVLAALDGDVIRVWPGTYVGTAINGKSLTIISVNGGSSVTVKGTLRIRNLSAGQSVALSGINVAGSIGGSAGRALVMTDCLGAIRVTDANITGGGRDGDDWSPSYADEGVYANSCEDIVLNHCVVVGGRCDYNGHGGFGSAALVSSASRLSAFDCTFAASYTTTSPHDADGTWGIDAVRASGGRFYAAACTFDATGGGDWDPWTGGPGVGGPGGDAFVAVGGDPWFLDCTFLPGMGGAGSSGPAADGVPYTWGIELPGDARLLSCPPLVDEFAPIDLQFQGTPGDIVSLRVRTTPGYAFDVLQGPYLLQPNSGRLWRILGTLPASGVLQASLPPRPLPVSGYQTLHFQGMLFGSERYFTSPAWTTAVGAPW